MLIIPAIDLLGGRVVRLTQGSFKQETSYSDAPAQIMEQWQDEGAQYVHVVDLDGAKEGAPKNIDALKEIIKVARIPVQFGGGLRTIESVREILDCGVSRVIIGTKAFEPTILDALVMQCQDRLAVGLDIFEGEIRTHGWQTGASSRSPESFCRYLENVGVKTIIVTDVSRDGMLQGPNFELLGQVLDATHIQVVISGGISKLADIEKLAAIKHKHFFGVIVGKALYEQKLDLKEAVKRFQNGSP